MKKNKKKKSFADFQRGLYEYYKRNLSDGDGVLSYDDFFDMISDYKNRNDKFLVYLGYSRKDKEHKKVVYVGTTIQYPLSRWYYHKIHGKNLEFVEYCRFDNEKDMLAKEYELICKYNPSIKDRLQNYNVPLTSEELESRKGNPEWCQCCLKRRVRLGYSLCYNCSNFKIRL